MTTVSKKVSSPAPKIEPMDDQLFQQFFQLDSHGAGAPWLSPDFMMGGNATSSSNTAASVHSTPEIATPQDLFLTSPTAEPACNTFEKHVPGFGDLDVSAILNSTSPLLDFAPIHHQEPSAPSSPAQDQVSATPVMEQLSPQITGLLSELDVTTLAALAAHGQDQAQQQQQVPQQKESPQSPVIVQPLPTTTQSKKRSRPQESSAPMDEAAIKRQKNTDAARRSRLRKVLKMESLEKRVAELEKANTTLLLRAAVLESEKSALLTKEASYEQRIKTLESQLAEAHQSLAGIASRP
ncbi:hypothetical protein RO3G_05672 [Lichtheimia corymbifera JMRC:FSU:9682]|uniref:BZIP domain-containing protein n=1 Tax=Lichtheimia corymbifera JMRC:FSU:9682 TaxID=1263082 RepID=A0A068RJV9_9FUNG|nr:hypothetical protein RO3G_05672 [Lichtheimia corymbifera JMRC:FSU:9682]